MATNLLHVIGHIDEPEHPITVTQYVRVFLCDSMGDLPATPEIGNIYLVKNKAICFVDPAGEYIMFKSKEDQ